MGEGENNLPWGAFYNSNDAKKTFSNIFSTEGDAQKCRGIVHQVCRDGDHHLGPLQDGRHPPGHHQDRGCQQSSGRYVR